MPACGRQARLKPCPTNHPMGDFKTQAEDCGYRVF